MTGMNVIVPTLNDSLGDFDALFGLWSQVNGDGLDVTFDFSRCRFLRQNAVAFIGGLAKMIESRGGSVTMDWATLKQAVGLNLGRNGFRKAFGDPTTFNVGESIPFRQDTQLDPAHIMDYLKTAWLGRGWVSVSSALRDAIVGRVWEIYANAFEHGGSPIGLFSCGQHYWKMKCLKLSVVDFGVGIPSNVRRFAGRSDIPAEKAMEWAFRSGTTTKPNGTGRGMGLDLLKQFVYINNGSLEVFSHEAYTVVDKLGERHSSRPLYFEGTLVNISLTCNDSQYCLASELPEQPLF